MLVTEREALLRIYLGESDRSDGRPLYEALVLKAREMKLAGATVLRGPMGFGHQSHLHTSKILRLSQDLPMVVEIVDRRERLECYLEAIGAWLTSALATLEPVDVIRYRQDPSDAAFA